MPIMDRKYFIHKHNKEIKNENKKYTGNNKETDINGININSYAKLEQQKRETN